MGVKARPLSPHLQVYRLPLTGLISISHRITGVLLCLVFVIVLAVGVALAAGEPTFFALQQALRSWIGQIVLWGGAFAFMFHLCHGVRHLLWDLGWGFASERLNALAWCELAAAVGLTGLLYAWW
jgi:succinate dehydrogenase / fumarate reductase, cytochrome b subunit